MKKKHGVFFGFAVLLIAAMFTMAGCNDDPPEEDPPSAAYLNEKEWLCTSGDMPKDITSITFVFLGTNQWTETFNGTGTNDGKTVSGTYALSGLTITFTITGGTLSGSGVPGPGTKYSSSFDAIQATKFTISEQNLIFNRQSSSASAAPTATYLNEKAWLCTSGDMPKDITSITFVFLGTNQWTETFNGTGTNDGKTVSGTYALSGLTITFTITGGTLSGSGVPGPGTKYSSSFDAIQATKFTISEQNLIFNRQPS